MLCDIVSRGGNFLLYIGPTARWSDPRDNGRSTIKIGEWLDVNGEAIHLALADGKKDCQWRKVIFMSIQNKNFIMACPILFSKWLLNPPSLDKLVKMLFYKKDDNLYALIPVLPESGVFYINDVKLSKNSKISMLGVPGDLEFKQHSNQIEVKTIETESEVFCSHVFKRRTSHAQ